MRSRRSNVHSSTSPPSLFELWRGLARHRSSSFGEASPEPWRRRAVALAEAEAAARREAQTRIATAVARRCLMKSRVRVFAAVIVILLSAFGKPSASLDVAAKQRSRAGFVTTGPSTLLGAGPSTLLGAGPSARPGAGPGEDFKPLTPALLLQPDPAARPPWRRTPPRRGFSPPQQKTA